MKPPVTIAEGRFNNNQLYRLMAERGLNYRRAATLCGISTSWFWKIATGKKLPEIEMLHRISTSFGKPVEYFFVQTVDSQADT